MKLKQQINDANLTPITEFSRYYTVCVLYIHTYIYEYTQFCPCEGAEASPAHSNRAH